MKNVAFSNINHAAVIVGGIALYNLCVGILGAVAGTGEMPVLTMEDAANIVTFISAAVILYKRNFTDVKPTTKIMAKKVNTNRSSIEEKVKD